jgi:hypothetical protein
MTLQEFVDKYADDDETKGRMLTDLLAHEDEIADRIRVLAAGLGTFPELVAGALLQVGLGSQPDDVTRAFIVTQFNARLVWLQEEARRQQGDGN